MKELTQREIIDSLASVDGNRIKVYDSYGCRYIIGYDNLSGHKAWKYCRDNSTGSFIPVSGLKEAIEAIHPVRIAYAYQK